MSSDSPAHDVFRFCRARQQARDALRHDPNVASIEELERQLFTGERALHQIAVQGQRVRIPLQRDHHRVAEVHGELVPGIGSCLGHEPSETARVFSRASSGGPGRAYLPGSWTRFANDRCLVVSRGLPGELQGEPERAAVGGRAREGRSTAALGVCRTAVIPGAVRFAGAPSPSHPRRGPRLSSAESEPESPASASCACAPPWIWGRAA